VVTTPQIGGWMDFVFVAGIRFDFWCALSVWFWVVVGGVRCFSKEKKEKES